MTADVLRFLVIGLGVFTVGSIVAVVRLHWLAYRRAEATGRVLQLRHVCEVAVAHGVFVVGITWAQFTQLGDPNYPSWRVILYAVAMCLTLLSLRDVAKAQKTRTA